MEYNRKKLLAMPDREDKNMEREYRSILIVPSGLKHDSGYMSIAVIGEFGEKNDPKYEICSYPDDIHWVVPASDTSRGYSMANLRTDCYYPQGILHFWGRGTFKVDWGSSTEIMFTPNTPNK